MLQGELITRMYIHKNSFSTYIFTSKKLSLLTRPLYKWPPQENANLKVLGKQELILFEKKKPRKHYFF